MLEEDFKKVMFKLKKEIRATQIKTMQQVNSHLIMLYFKIGKVLNDNFMYGNKFIDDVVLIWLFQI